MANPIACLDEEVLARVNAGQLSDPEIDQIATHLESCPRCARVAQDIEAYGVLQKAAAGGKEIEAQPQPVVGQLIDRLRLLTAIETSTGSQETPLPQTVVTEDALAQLLAPAQSPGELGRLGGYRILGVLGRGGMGLVLEAEDIVLSRRVALKVILPHLVQQPQLRQRFLREARAAAAIQNDHIVPIHQVGEERGIPFIAMPLLSGESLESRLQRDKVLPVKEVLRLGQQIALALSAAHDKRMIHRDIKPSNIWLETVAPGTARVKVLDFGLARDTNVEAEPLTGLETILGTPAYMAPEQVDNRPLDSRCDLFSLGCVLYRMTTGKLPFRGESALQIVRSLATDTPEAPAGLNPEIPADLSNLTLQLLAKEPDDRPATATEVGQRLAQIELKPSSTQQGSTQRVRPRRALAIACAVCFIAVAIIYWQVVVIRDREGNEIARIKVPKEGSIVITGRRDSTEEKKLPVPNVTGGKAVPLALSPLDKLDPKAIPEEERRPDDPPELVALLGSHRQCLPDTGGGGMAISADGKRVAAGGTIWDFDTSQAIALPSSDLSRAFSPDGRRLYGGNRIIDLDRWLERQKKSTSVETKDTDILLSFTPSFYHFNPHFSWDGSLMVLETWGPDNVLLWRLGQNSATRLGEWADYFSPALSQDGKILAMVNTKNLTVHLFDIDGEKVRTRGLLAPDFKAGFRSGPNPMSNLRFTHDGRLAVLPARAKNTDPWTLELWSVLKPKPRRVGTIHTEDPLFRFAAKAPRMVTWGGGAFRLWQVTESGANELSTGSLGFGGQINDVAISADGNRLACVHNIGAISFWEVKDGKLVERNPLTPPPASNWGYFHFSPQGEYLMTCGEAGTTIWRFGDVSPKGFVPKELSHGNIRTTAFFNRDSFATQGRMELFTWKITPTGVTQIGTLGLPFHADALSFASAETGIVVARCYEGKDKSFGRIFDLQKPGGTGGELFAIPTINNNWPAAHLSANGNVFAILIPEREGERQAARIFDIQGTKATERYDIPVQGKIGYYRFRVSPDGQWLIAGNGLWRLERNEAKLYRSGAGVAFYPDSRRWLIQQTDRLELRDIETGDVLWSTRLSINDAEVALDGRHLLVGNPDSTAFILRLPPVPLAASTKKTAPQ